MRLIRVVSLSALAVLASAAQAQQLDASKANNAFGYLTYSSVGAGQTGINYSNVASTGSTAAGAASVSTSGSSLVAVSRPYKVFNAAGNPVSTTVTGTITAARLAPILLKAAKLAPVLGTGIAIYDMLKETGIDAAKQSNGSINFSQQSSLFAVSCQAGNITGTLAGLGASCSGALSSYWRSNGYPSCSYNLSTSDYGSYGTIRLGYNGVSCGGYPNLTAYQSGTTVNTLTEQEVADAIANTSGWPSSSSMSKAVTDSLTVTGDQVVPSAPTVTGPSTSPGTTKTVTNPDGSKVVSTTNYNHTYEGNNITTGAVTTNNTYNTSNVITNTTTETTDAVPQPDPAKTDCEKNPDAIGCSKYGDPTSTDKLPNINADVSTIPSISFASNSSCPSPVTFTVLGRSLAFSYDSTCNVLESVVKPILLVLAAGLSLFVFVGGFKS